MSDASLLERITDAQRAMRPSEVKVAAVMLADPEAALAMTMAGLATAAQVSEPTVMRFCAALGFDGFQSFKLALAQALAIGIPVTHSAITVHDSTAQIALKIFDHTLTSLDLARRSLDPDAFSAAVDILLGADQVLFIGLGASGIIAQDALQQAVLLGVPCSAPADLHQQYMQASMLDAKSVLVAISNTGRSRSIVQIAAQAKTRGATILAIVGGPSPLADLSDVALILRTFEDTDVYTPTVSRLAGLAMVDALATAIAVRRGPEHLARVRDMKGDLAEWRGSLSSD
ncbi:MAG: SIS domain-containing protein [Bifidobacteriaceae bacterium]|jgi:RpiR family carbohydrate utilization transcriptional regulator|nr:SIS domain-containing protein [Bifidobacteriaceae bacterium]